MYCNIVLLQYMYLFLKPPSWSPLYPIGQWWQNYDTRVTSDCDTPFFGKPCLEPLTLNIRHWIRALWCIVIIINSCAMLIDDSTLVYNNNKNINMPKIKKLLFRSDTRWEKNTKKNSFDTPTKKSCHHCYRLQIKTDDLSFTW